MHRACGAVVQRLPFSAALHLPAFTIARGDSDSDSDSDSWLSPHSHAQCPLRFWCLLPGTPLFRRPFCHKSQRSLALAPRRNSIDNYFGSLLSFFLPEPADAHAGYELRYVILCLCFAWEDLWRFLVPGVRPPRPCAEQLKQALGDYATQLDNSCCAINWAMVWGWFGTRKGNNQKGCSSGQTSKLPQRNVRMVRTWSLSSPCFARAPTANLRILTLASNGTCLRSFASDCR
mmetsp:Transcript_24850/g.42861  ORF Transcript_24850/g.42861 Transcript_24850/m.42861 type:complete len:232 (+) Transcript_24850:3185-3880(+)